MHEWGLTGSRGHVANLITSTRYIYTAWNTSRAAKTEQKRKEEKGEERSEIISTVGKWGPAMG